MAHFCRLVLCDGRKGKKREKKIKIKTRNKQKQPGVKQAVGQKINDKAFCISTLFFIQNPWGQLYFKLLDLFQIPEQKPAA